MQTEAGSQKCCCAQLCCLNVLLKIRANVLNVTSSVPTQNGSLVRGKGAQSTFCKEEAVSALNPKGIHLKTKWFSCPKSKNIQNKLLGVS